MAVSGELHSIPANVQKLVSARSTAGSMPHLGRFRILDPLRFFHSVGTVAVADQRLSVPPNPAVRQVLGEAEFRFRAEALIRISLNEISRFRCSSQRARRTQLKLLARVSLPTDLSSG